MEQILLLTEKITNQLYQLINSGITPSIQPEEKEKWILQLNNIFSKISSIPDPISIIETNTSTEMTFVEGGSFFMGSEITESAKKVILTDFFISPFPVTFDEFDLFCQTANREFIDDNEFGRGKRPVINVNWLQALEFCNWKSTQEGFRPCYSNLGIRPQWDLNANGYRLPTEAEWEYSAQGGQLDKEWGKRFSGGQYLDLFGWSEDNSRGKTHPVGEKQPNELGLYDMSGNVWEWCWDFYGEAELFSERGVNPRGPETGIEKVIRGGSYFNPSSEANVFYRNCLAPLIKLPYVGFRIARTEKK